MNSKRRDHSKVATPPNRKHPLPEKSESKSYVMVFLQSTDESYVL